MTTTPAPPPSTSGGRCSACRRSGRLALMFVRMPQRAHRHDAGWMLGRTLVELTHVRAKTGQPHDAVAMVRRNGQATREIVVCAAWG